MVFKLDTASKIVSNLADDTFGKPLMENSMRGLFAEYMVSEALGERCRVVGRDWYPWDLQIGDDENVFPDRIRIQVKNTARLQSWYPLTSKLSKCQWSLKISKKPYEFDSWYRNVPCEDYGHMCDLYVLCHHPIEDVNIANHRDLEQWNFYLVPVIGSKMMYKAYEKPEGQKGNASYTVVPESLRKGIRGRVPVEPVSFDTLDIRVVENALGL